MKRRTQFSFATLAALLLTVTQAAADDGTKPPPSIVEDGPVSVRLTADRVEARIADPIEVRLEVEAPPKTHVVLPKVEGQLGEFEVRTSEAFNDFPSASAAGTRLSVLRLRLETIKTGELVIPPLEVQYSVEGAATAANTVWTKPLAIHITSVLEERADPTKFRDIKEAVDVVVPEPPSYAWLGWAAAGSGTALAAGLVLVALRRRRSPSPAAWALESLEDVRRMKIETAADAEVVIKEVVDIVREFFGLEFGVPAIARTSRELVLQAKRKFRLSESAVESLAWLVSLADEIKFARRGSGEKQAREAIERARAFVAECEAQRTAQAKEVA